MPVDFGLVLFGPTFARGSVKDCSGAGPEFTYDERFRIAELPLHAIGRRGLAFIAAHVLVEPDHFASGSSGILYCPANEVTLEFFQL